MVALVEALLLAGLVLPTAAVKVGRRDVPLSSKTLQVPDEVGYWPIAPTTPPNPRFAAIALKRQVNSKTCGYFEINSEAFACEIRSSCVTTNGKFGCAVGSQPSTTCLDDSNKICRTNGQGPLTLCWFVSTFLLFLPPHGRTCSSNLYIPQTDIPQRYQHQHQISPLRHSPQDRGLRYHHHRLSLRQQRPRGLPACRRDHRTIDISTSHHRNNVGSGFGF
ncbi:hypothetical protein LX32DRAFT_102528 [Colletotrichum zoysiae]|uniref:Uncharacterized protein n=1 Tax=Colletotrichum zoysiae TaxID=1216348 RepID=A0AAD9HRN7_9PEZI|nr:hypothetical protein LX32DRAFT_102528 [Colletotrichum zoysiae]